MNQRREKDTTSLSFKSKKQKYSENWKFNYVTNVNTSLHKKKNTFIERLKQKEVRSLAGPLATSTEHNPARRGRPQRHGRAVEASPEPPGGARGRRGGAEPRPSVAPDWQPPGPRSRHAAGGERHNRKWVLVPGLRRSGGTQRPVSGAAVSSARRS